MELKYSIDENRSFPLTIISGVPADSMVLSFDENLDEIADFLEVLNRRTELLDEKYIKMKKCLSLSSPDLFYALPQTSVRKTLQKVEKVLRIALEDKENREYLVTYLTIKRFLRGLSAPLVDQKTLTSVVNNTEHENVASRIKAFAPTDKGFAPKTSYSMTGTVTGRLSVSGGPQILTLNSTARKIFKSRYNNGSILQIDLVAAEPNIALKLSGRNHKVKGGDVYSFLSQEVFNSNVSRDICKLITLSVLYGQSSKNLEKRLPKDMSAARVIRSTRDFFDVDNLERMLRKKVLSSNLRNIFGRPINLRLEETRLCLNYYLQSSAAELSILLFSEWLKDHQENVVPLYVIHDALIVDCSQSVTKSLLSKEVISLRLGDWSFEAKISKLSDT